jgi:hypothetical protein
MKKKLSLKREVLRNLTPAALSLVAGGAQAANTANSGNLAVSPNDLTIGPDVPYSADAGCNELSL